jgi:hypothetical protein
MTKMLYGRGLDWNERWKVKCERGWHDNEMDTMNKQTNNRDEEGWYGEMDTSGRGWMDGWMEC